jgi:hypothetical protein
MNIVLEIVGGILAARPIHLHAAGVSLKLLAKNAYLPTTASSGIKPFGEKRPVRNSDRAFRVGSSHAGTMHR